MAYQPENPNGQATSASSTPVVPASDWTPNLPSNAAKETGGNLAAILTALADVANIPAQGQALAAGSLPVVLTAAQLASLIAAIGTTNAAVPTSAILAGATDGTNIQPFQTGGAVQTATSRPLAVAQFIGNGTNFDAARGNTAISVLTSAARTTTQTQADQTNYNGRGIVVVLDVTSAGSGSITLEIDAKDAVSGKYYSLLTGAAVVSNSTNIYTVYPGLTAVTNVTANNVLPRTFRVLVTANNANTVTYSVGATVLV